MLSELIIFAVVLVVLQGAMGVLFMYLCMKTFMSKKFIKKYTKMAMEVANEITDETIED